MDFIPFIIWLGSIALSIAVAVAIIVGAIALRRMSFLFMNHLQGETGSAISAAMIPAASPNEPHRLRVTNTSNAPAYKVKLISGSVFRAVTPDGSTQTFNREDNILPTTHITALLPGQTLDFPLGEIKPPAAEIPDNDEPFEDHALLDYLNQPTSLNGNPTRVLLGTQHLQHASGT